MPLTDDQDKWLSGFAAVKVAGDKAKDAVEARRLAQNKIEFELMDKRDGLRDFLEATTFEKPAESVFDSVKATLGMADKIRLLEPGGDPMKEFDIFEDAKFLSDEDADRAQEVQAKLKELYNLMYEMEAMTYGDPPQKVYPDPMAIKADLWDPLVREGIIPENFVPPRFSEVEQTFGAASELYEERLQEYTENLGEWDIFAENFNGVATCAKLGLDLTAAIVSATGPDATKTVETLNLIGASVAAVGAGTEAALKDKDVVKSFDSFTTVVTNTLTAAAGEGVGKAVGSVITAAVHSYPFGKRIKTWRDTGEWSWSEAIADLGDAVGKGIAAGDGASDSTYYADVGKIVTASFKAVSAGVSTLGAEKEDRMLDVLMAKLGAEANSIAGALVSISKEHETNRALAAEAEKLGRALNEEEKEEVTKGVSDKYPSDEVLEAGDSLEDIAEAFQERNEAVGEGFKAFDEAEQARLKQEAQAAMDAKMKDYMETPDPVFEAMLATGFGEATYGDTPPEGDDSPEAARIRAEQEERRIKSIESLIAIQKKHEATYKLSQTIVNTAKSTAVAALGDKIPGLSVVAVAQELIQSMHEAAKQGSEFLLWQDNMTMGNNAHTVQVEAILSRHGLQKRQTIEAGIAAALKAAQLVGEVLKLAGQMAPAGYAVSATAMTGAVVLEAASKVADAATVKRGWDLYKTAIAEPQNRKAARRAIRANPTLAKYALAYGAVVEKNPIAKEVMRRAGINETALADPSASVGKVVEYMELLYKDDPDVLRTTAIPKAWHAGPVELTASSWTVSIFNAQNADAKPKKRAEPLLAPLDATGVAGSLQSYELAAAGVKDTNTHREQLDALDVAIKAAERLEIAFYRLKPRTAESTSETHKEVKEYIDALVGKCTLQKREWEAMVPDIESAIARHSVDAAQDGATV
ncbi:MAG: hypothetical protein AAGB05_13335 [Pseudomonadota bacterium]